MNLYFSCIFAFQNIHNFNIMKRNFLLAVMALAALMVASCQKEEVGRILTATIEQYEHNAKADSKAYINDDYYACWENNDKVNINGIQCTIRFENGSQGAANTAKIDGSEDFGEEDNLLAFYPASQVTNLSAAGGIVTLPHTQTYEERNGRQIINNPMAAYCLAGSDELKFRNLAALLKVTITAPATDDLSVKTIYVKGEEDQMLWGTSRLTLDYQHQPMLEKMTNGSASVALSFGDHPAAIGAGSSKSFYIVVPAGSDFFNFTIQVLTDQKAYWKTSKVNQTLPRNHIGAIAYNPSDADNVSAILYKGSIDGFKADAFGGAQVLSNDNGILLFDRPITSIGLMAFAFCSGLTSITLPETLTEIGGGAFGFCSSLASITLPDSLTSIGDNAFEGCTSLVSIDLSHTKVSSIGNYAFYCCSNLTSITWPATLTLIGQNAFLFCYSLISIDLSGTSLTSIWKAAFKDCRGLTSVTLPSSLTSIEYGAFSGCTNLAHVTLPASLTDIEGDMFRGCSNLTYIDLPASLISIRDNAFSGCESLARVDCHATDAPALGVGAFFSIKTGAELHVPIGSVTNYSSDSEWFRSFGENIVEGFN